MEKQGASVAFYFYSFVKQSERRVAHRTDLGSSPRALQLADWNIHIVMDIHDLFSAAVNLRRVKIWESFWFGGRKWLQSFPQQQD